MMTSFILILIISLAALGLWGGSFLLRLDMLRLSQRSKYSAKYNEAMSDFLSQEVQLPESVLHSLEYWNNAVTDKRFAMKVAMLLIRVNNDIKRGAPTPAAKIELIEFFQTYPDLERKYTSALLHAIITASYLSRFWGIIIRSAVVDLYDGERSSTEIEKFTENVQTKVRVSKSRDFGDIIPSAA